MSQESEKTNLYIELTKEAFDNLNYLIFKKNKEKGTFVSKKEIIVGLINEKAEDLKET